MPNHFKRDSFFGVVRPYANYANEPFPPPPLPPTPLPKAIKKLTTGLRMQPSLHCFIGCVAGRCDSSAEMYAASTETSSDKIPSTPVPFVKAAQNSTMLSVTVAVGSGLLFLNICIGLGLYRQVRSDLLQKESAKLSREETKKKLQLQYQTYAVNHQTGTNDINYMNNAGGQQLGYLPPPPPSLSQYPPITNSTTTPLDSTSSKVNDFEPCRLGAYQNYDPAHNSDTLTTKCSFQEQVHIISLKIHFCRLDLRQRQCN
ncbi:unnamed protein product [Gongylonema pulchrum]|uniref:Uncharacterized protein n=1 Tax=Gongylonema pulchrum TaxID=637853 RepID=A0A3P7M6G6_9BILA|nr:unnamed protein product [Gongylonema pulchrum]